MKKAKKVFFLISIFVIIALVYVLYSPFFDIQNIKVEGQNKLSREYIINLSEVQLGQNILKLNISQIERNLKREPYIETIKVKREFPNGICISVVERKPIGIISYMGSYILVDKNGIALELISKTKDYYLPEIKGIKLEKVTFGKSLLRENMEGLKVGLNILTLLNKDDLFFRIEYVNVEDPQNLILCVDKRIEVNLGSVSKLTDEGLHWRFDVLKGILESGKIPKDQRGIIYIGDRDENPRFVPIDLKTYH